MRTIEVNDAAEVIVGGDGASPYLLTCEHASVRLPDGWAWSEDDAFVVGDHWSWDPGAAEVCRELAESLGAPAVLSRFSRLLCDPNRSEGDPSVFRDVAEGRPLAINRDLSAEDRERRLAGYYRPFHAAVDRTARAWPGRILLSIHTFTPVYEGTRREVELAVLFDDEDDLAIDLAMHLVDRGLPTWLNEPWSGKEGLIHSAKRHAAAHGRAALELEVRNDLATSADWRASALPRIAEALRALLEPVGETEMDPLTGE